jgi:hypothetical protein
LYPDLPSERFRAKGNLFRRSDIEFHSRFIGTQSAA